MKLNSKQREALIELKRLERICDKARRDYDVQRDKLDELLTTDAYVGKGKVLKVTGWSHKGKDIRVAVVRYVKDYGGKDAVVIGGNVIKKDGKVGKIYSAFREMIDD